MPWTAYASPFFIGTFGPHTLRFRSSDAAGNDEAAKSVSWGAVTASEQLTGLGDFVSRLGLEPGLGTSLRAKLTDAQKALDASKDPCHSLDEFAKSVLDQAGKANAKLTRADAALLLSVNQTETLLGCLPAGSFTPNAETALNALGAKVDGLGTDEALNELGNLVRQAGKFLAEHKTGAACRTVGDWNGVVASLASRGKLTPAQAADLTGAVDGILIGLNCA